MNVFIALTSNVTSVCEEIFSKPPTNLPILIIHNLISPSSFKCQHVKKCIGEAAANKHAAMLKGKAGKKRLKDYMERLNI